MGKDWLYKAGGDNDHGGGKSPSATAATRKRANEKIKKDKSNSSSGCMSAFFNMFDVQHHQFRLHHPSFISESTISNLLDTNIDFRGVEAPRNSLESPESVVDVALESSSSKAKEDMNLNLPIGGIQIKTQRSRFTEDISSECSSSPSTKTPSLVARLMGLDLLPEYSSPRPSSDATPVNSHHRSRSLPATPRLSSASRLLTDNEYHHRLSLQADKENVNSSRCQENDRKTQYAKQIANQVRERINRRLGIDITNTMSSTRHKESRRDSNLVLLKPNKPPVPLSPAQSLDVLETTTKAKQDSKNRNHGLQKPKKPSTPLLTLAQSHALETTKAKQDSTHSLSSPKLRLLDINNNLTKPMSHSQLSSLKEVLSKPKPLPQVSTTPLKLEKPVKEQKIKRIASERYDSRLKKMHQQEQFVDKIFKIKSTPSSNHHGHHVNVKNTTKFHSFKKEMTSPCSTAKLPQNQVSLATMTHSPSNLNSSYKAHSTHTFNLAGPFADHFDYISKILNQCGIEITTPISSGRWYIPSHPLHPSIFHQLEKHYQGKLIFDLLDEFLVEMLKPYMNRPHDSFVMCTSELIKKLCVKVRDSSKAKCDEMEDIDSLIDRDMGRSMRRMWSTTAELEAESIVKEIENEILETLVHEMTSLLRYECS